jgi:hypothetical protein
MKSHWITHHDKRVFIADFSNCGSDAATIRAECEAVKAEFSREAPASVRSITNAEGMFSNADVIKALAELLSYSNKYVFRRAVVGASGFRKYFLETFANFTGKASFMAFDTIEQALDWIIQD